MSNWKEREWRGLKKSKICIKRQSHCNSKIIVFKSLARHCGLEVYNCNFRNVSKKVTPVLLHVTSRKQHIQTWHKHATFLIYYILYRYMHDHRNVLLSVINVTIQGNTMWNTLRTNLSSKTRSSIVIHGFHKQTRKSLLSTFKLDGTVKQNGIEVNLSILFILNNNYSDIDCRPYFHIRLSYLFLS